MYSPLNKSQKVTHDTVKSECWECWESLIKQEYATVWQGFKGNNDCILNTLEGTPVSLMGK